jgi:toxin ParE1/3/4
MTAKRVLVRPEAESDVKDAYEWYEAQRKGLGEHFLLCIEDALSRAARNPSMYSVVYKEVRRVLTHRFPFGVFFIEADEYISVLAVLHARRSPKHWKSRT